jgi:hypothetical protein
MPEKTLKRMAIVKNSVPVLSRNCADWKPAVEIYLKAHRERGP